jgi:hypothetical protein
MNSAVYVYYNFFVAFGYGAVVKLQVSMPLGVEKIGRYKPLIFTRQ